MNTYWVNEKGPRGSSASEGLGLTQADSLFNLMQRTDSMESMDSGDGNPKTRTSKNGKRRKSRKFSTLLSKTPIDKIGEENESMEFSSPDIGGNSARRGSRSDSSMRRSSASIGSSMRRSSHTDTRSEASNLRRSGTSDATPPPEEPLRALRKQFRSSAAKRNSSTTREPTPKGAAGEADA